MGNLDGSTPQILPYREFTQDTKSWAVFGQATWNITETFRTTLGMRYAVEEKEGMRSQITWVPAANTNLDNAGPLAAGLLAGFNWADHYGDNALAGSETNYNFTPSINVQYDLNEDTMLYASFSTGYKSGGYDARGINGLPQGGTITATTSHLDNFYYDDEEAETIELGVKMTLLNGAAELNAALFRTDYTDMQVSIHDGGVGFAVQNAGEARVQGLEMDGRWQLTENLMATASLAYLDFEWKDYKAGVCPGDGPSLPASPTVAGNCDYSGKENVHTPEWSASLGVSHSYALSDGLELKSALDMNFKDNHYTTVDLDSRQEQSAYTLVNARVALSSLDANWEVALVGNNLTDQEVRLFGASIAASQGGYANMLNRPRTIAIEGSYSF